MYTDYKQQNRYGFGPIDFSALTFATYATKFYLGEAYGAKANLSKTTNDSTHTKPLDHKALKQMFHKKALFDILCHASFEPLGTKQTLTIAYSGTAGAAGSSVWKIYGESPVTVNIANGTTATNAGKAAVAALAGLVNWTASESSGTVTLTRKVAAANITATDTTKFSVTDISSTTQTLGGQTSGSASFTAGTSGVAPEADTTHVFRFDLKSVNNDDELDAYIAGGDLDPIVSIYIKGGQVFASNTPAFESLMPSNIGLKSWIEVSMPNISSTSTTMTAGILELGYDAN